MFTLRNIAAFLILVAPICSAQTRRDTAKDIDKYFGQATDPLRMAIKPAKPSFSRHEPFVFVVTFTNTSEGPVFLNVGSLFSFRAYLTTIKKDPLYVTTYAMSFSPKGTSGPPRQEDYKEIPRGKSFTVKVTSQEVVMVSPARYAGINHPSWDERKPGTLKFFLKYFSGRVFQRQV